MGRIKMLINLKEALAYGERNNCAIAAFNVFGFEDASAVIRAAEEEKVPAILMTNKVAVSHMPVKVLGAMLREMAELTPVPVVIHLDHSPSVESVREGIEAGYTSVMLDASQRPYAENVRMTREVISMARPHGISVESEIGSVGYSDAAGVQNIYTDPAEAEQFFMDTAVDALAVSIGNVHRMTTQTVHLQFERLAQIRERVSAPLVLHGSSGIPDDELQQAIRGGIRKVNIGTALRMEFGRTLRQGMEENPDVFDRIALFGPCMEAVYMKAKEKIRLMK